MIRVAAMRLRGASVTALVGASGTGKSFRSRPLAERRGIRIIIDDGLIIRDATILMGSWAKKEDYLRTAVRRALFDDPAHAAEARDLLRREGLPSLLVLGTSERMVRCITRNLWLPAPAEVIRITDVSAPEEIDLARRTRRVRQSHAAPLPLVRIRASGIGGFLARVARRFGTWRPPLSANPRGGVVITERALYQIASHCVGEYAPGSRIARILAAEVGGMYDVGIHLSLSAPVEGGTLHALRDSLQHGLERYSGLLVRRVDLVVDEVAPKDA